MPKFSSTNQPDSPDDRTQLTVDQKIAMLEAKIARAREEKRAQETGQKVIAGGMVIAIAEKDADYRKRLIDQLEKYVTRDADKKRIDPLIARLKAIGVPEEKAAAAVAGKK